MKATPTPILYRAQSRHPPSARKHEEPRKRAAKPIKPEGAPNPKPKRPERTPRNNDDIGERERGQMKEAFEAPELEWQGGVSPLNRREVCGNG